jgi:carbon-monoxide dehydrogenase medium subunit
MDIAVVGAGVNLSLDESGVCSAARVALGAVAPTAMLVPEAGAALAGTRLEDADLQTMAAAVSAACKPIDDKRGTVEYRVKVAGVIARRACAIAIERARNN